MNATTIDAVRADIRRVLETLADGHSFADGEDVFERGVVRVAATWAATAVPGENRQE